MTSVSRDQQIRIRKYKKYFKKKLKKKEDLLLPRDYPALLSFSLSMVRTVGVLRAPLCALTATSDNVSNNNTTTVADKQSHPLILGVIQPS